MHAHNFCPVQCFGGSYHAMNRLCVWTFSSHVSQPESQNHKCTYCISVWTQKWISISNSRRSNISHELMLQGLQRGWLERALEPNVYNTNLMPVDCVHKSIHFENLMNIKRNLKGHLIIWRKATDHLMSNTTPCVQCWKLLCTLRRSGLCGISNLDYRPHV